MASRKNGAVGGDPACALNLRGLDSGRPTHEAIDLDLKHTAAALETVLRAFLTEGMVSGWWQATQPGKTQG